MAADELNKAAGKFLEAEKENDPSGMRAAAEDMVKTFNEPLKSMDKASDSLNQFYAKMLKEAAVDNKDLLSAVGVSIKKDGQLSIDEEKWKDIETEALMQAFGSGSVFNEKTSFLADHISDHAEAHAGSVTNQYGSDGALSSVYSSKMDFWG